LRSEFLIHAADVEGLCQGIDEELVASESCLPTVGCLFLQSQNLENGWRFPQRMLVVQKVDRTWLSLEDLLFKYLSQLLLTLTLLIGSQEDELI
jgi:hypothetical protein